MVRAKSETSVSEDNSEDTGSDDDDEDSDESQTGETTETAPTTTNSTTGDLDDDEEDDDEEEEEDDEYIEMEGKGNSTSTSTAKASTTRNTLGKASGVGSLASKGRPSGRPSEGTAPPKGKSTQGSLRASQLPTDKGRTTKTSTRPSNAPPRGSQGDTKRSRTLSQRESAGNMRSSKKGGSQSKPRRSASSSWNGPCTCMEEEESEETEEDEEDEDDDDNQCTCKRKGTPAPRQSRMRGCQSKSGFQTIQVPDATEVLKVEWSVKMPKQLYVSGGANNLVWTPDVRSCLTTSSLIAGKVIGAVSENQPSGCQSGYNQQMMNPSASFYQDAGGCQGGGGGYPPGAGFGSQQPYYGGFNYGQGMMMPEPLPPSGPRYMPPPPPQMSCNQPPMCPSCGCSFMML